MSKVFKFNEDNLNPFRFSEPELLQEIGEYIRSTYGQHYVGDDGKGLQIQDLLHSIDIAVPFCQANAIKYLARYGKKEGKNRKDILKAIHYAILLMHFEDDLAGHEDDLNTQGGNYPDSPVGDKKVNRADLRYTPAFRRK